MKRLKQVTEQNGCGDKPVWVTETGFNVNHFKSADKRDMALASMLISPWYYGADMTCSYSWNNSIFTNLYDNGKKAATETAAAYIMLHQWLDGAAITEFKPGKQDARICALEKNGATARIIWRTGPGKAAYKIDAAWGGRIYTLDGANTPVPADGTIQLGNRPLLISDKTFFDQPK